MMDAFREDRETNVPWRFIHAALEIAAGVMLALIACLALQYGW